MILSRLVANYITFAVGEVLLLVLTICSLAAIFPRVSPGCLPDQDSNTNSAMKWKFRYMDNRLWVSIDVCLHRSATCTHSCVQLHRLKSCSLGGINAPGSWVLINITMKMFPVLWSPSGTRACQDVSPLFKVTSTSFLTFLTPSPPSPSSCLNGCFSFNNSSWWRPRCSLTTLPDVMLKLLPFSLRCPK